MFKNNGITLIALIVTIIVLLILAGISITFLFGENGILNKAENAKLENEKAEVLEKLKVKVMDLSVNEIGNNSNKVKLSDIKDNLLNDSEVKNVQLMQGETEKDEYVIGSFNGYNFYIDNNLNINIGDLDLNFNSTLEGQNLTSDSIINALSNNKLVDGYYTLKINGETYESHIYVFNGNQTWDSMVFGDNTDVANATAEAKRMVIVKVIGDLTINSGATITSFASASGYGGPKGLFIYCTGNLTNNGTISMTARGAKATGQNVYLWKNENSSYEFVPAVGGNGASGGYQSAGGTTNGSPGAAGTNRATGGRWIWTKKLWYRRSRTEKVHHIQDGTGGGGRRI